MAPKNRMDDQSGALTPEQPQFVTGLSPERLCARIALRIRRERTLLGASQADFAKAAGIPLRTYKRFEATGHASLENFVRVISVFERVSALELLFPPKPVSSRTLDQVRRKFEVQQLFDALHGKRNRQP